MSPSAKWAAVLGAALLYDVACDRRHDGSTLSQATRDIYRTDTALGRAAFVASWLALSYWLIPHINKLSDSSS